MNEADENRIKQLAQEVGDMGVIARALLSIMENFDLKRPEPKQSGYLTVDDVIKNQSDFKAGDLVEVKEDYDYNYYEIFKYFVPKKSYKVINVGNTAYVVDDMGDHFLASRKYFNSYTPSWSKGAQ